MKTWLFMARPEVQSRRFQEQLSHSWGAYELGDYTQAADVLSRAVLEEPDNLFILDAYARALYWVEAEGERSFQAYDRLVAMLDDQPLPEEATIRPAPGEPPDPTAGPVDTLLIDGWFVESYWKKGTLHLDREEWDAAAFEISRALCGMGHNGSAALHEQALSYLAEAYFHLEEWDDVIRFSQAALAMNKDNEYVLEYYEKARQNRRMPPPPPAP